MLFKSIETLAPLSSGLAMCIRGNYLATSLNDEILVTDLNTGKKLMQFEGDSEQIAALAMTPDREFLIAASRSFQILVFSLESQTLVHTFAKAHDSAILALECDPTSTLLASGGSEGAVKVWDLRNLRLTHNLKGHGAPISSLAFFGQLGTAEWRLASGSEDGKIIVWDLVKSKIQHNLANHANAVTSLKWTSTGEALISGGRDKIVSIWHGSSLTSTIPIMDTVEDLGTVCGHIYVVSPQVIRILSLTAETVSTYKLSSSESEFVKVISSENDELMALLSDQSLVACSVDAGQIAFSRMLSTNHNEIIDLVSKDRDVVLATNSKDLRVINLDGNLLEFKQIVGHKDIVLAIDVLGNWLVSGGKDGEARLFDLTNLECKIVFKGHTGPVGAVALSKGDVSVPQFVLTGSQDLTVKRWGADGEAVYTRKAHDKDINAIDVNAGNQLFATASQDRTIKVWRCDTGDVAGVLKGHKRGVWSVKFAPNSTLVSGSGDKCVRMWNLNDYTCTRTFEGHLGSVLKVLPYTATEIASAGGDGLIKVWDIKSNECLSTLDGHEDKVWALTKDSAGQLVSGGGDGVLNVWEDCTEEEQAKAELEEQENLEMQQELDNSVRSQKWDKAIRIALKLNRPLKLLNLFTDVRDRMEPESITGVRDVDVVIQTLDDDMLYILLERVRDWNTSGKTSILAQTLLRVVLLAPDADKRLSNPRVLKLLGQITPYTQRHLTRVSEMLDASYALDYILKEMTL